MEKLFCKSLAGRFYPLNLRAKVFAVFALLILVVSISFAAFFVNNQVRLMMQGLMENGFLISRILAHNVRLGVFSENTELLKNPIEGVFQHEDVLEVYVFNAEGGLLKKQQRGYDHKVADQGQRGTDFNNRMIEEMTGSHKPGFSEKKDRIEFWSKVFLAPVYPQDELMFFDEQTPDVKSAPIGYVKVTLSKARLKKQFSGLLAKSFLIGGIFLIICSGITFFIARNVTRPLKSLTDGVESLGKGDRVEMIPVETRDEIGQLAQAFNDMSASLKRREEEKSTLEEQLRQARKMEAIGTLSGGIAHDLNNILTVIMGFSSFLQVRLADDSVLKTNVEEILKAGRRAADLIKSLLVFSSKQIITPRQIDLNESIENLRKILTRLIREDIEIKVNLTEESLPLMADPVQVDQVLMNLVTNARDAMPQGGKLIIATEYVEVDKAFFKTFENIKPGPYALLSVSDTGAGMDQDTKERIFDPFFTTKAKGEGTGLGLSMIYGIVKQHEGHIEVKSDPAKGSTFKIYFPLAEHAPQVEKPVETGDQLSGTEMVLIAEDDDSVRTLAKEALDQYGYETEEARDGDDAVEKFKERSNSIQFLLLDVIMPKKNGMEVLHEIKRISPNIKALFMSGHTFDLLDRKGVIEEGIELIYKPFTPTILLKKIREVLDG